METKATTIDDMPLTRFHWRIAALAAGGPFCDGYILGIIGVALAMMTPVFKLSAAWIGLIGSSTMIGMVIGGLFGGYVTDKIGRKAMYTFDLLALLVISALQFFISDIWQLFVLRLLMGVAVGADYPIAASYVTEFMPRKARGPMLSSLVLSWWLGYVVSFAMGYLLSNDAANWRITIASSSIPALIVFLLRIGAPESPRWLITRGRHKEARAIIDTHLGPKVLLPEQWAADRQAPRFNYMAMFRGGYGKLLLFVSLFWCLQGAPSYAIHTLQPQLLSSLHVHDPYFATMIITALALLGIVPSVLYLVNRLGRRKLLLSTFVLMILPLVYIGLVEQRPAWATIVAFIVFTVAESAGSALQFVYPNELFPTEFRGSAVGFATAMSRIGTSTSTFLLPIGYTTIGAQSSILIIAGLVGAGLIVSALWAPETSGLSLVEAEAIGAGRS